MQVAIITTLEQFGAFFLFWMSSLRSVFRRPFRGRHLLEQLERIGVESVPIIGLSSLAIGMIFSLQMVQLLQPFRAEVAVGTAVAVTLARELAPIITALMLIGKNGSAMAAEIGTMRVTEQIDAMETMSVDPIQFLTTPRVMACIVMFPMLTLMANVVGVFGAWVIAVGVMDVESATYLEQMFRVLSAGDILQGMVKAAVMGYLTAIICTFYGYYAENGAQGVGEASTRAVVTSSVAILIADYVMAMAFWG
ncbi:MAG: ABC transporter permease [Spirochaeta sp.]|nr:ABC transporter permease [Spirochaeta sp.]